jgi:hypothetical protein
MAKRLSMSEINQWVDNDEGLYNWWKASKQRKRQFIIDNRDELEACINRVLNGSKPAHYLAYGGGYVNQRLS